MSDVTICNLALGKIGAERIATLADAKQSARYCTLFYAQTRDEVLQSHPWNFAIKRASLVADVTAPAFGWGVRYPLPADSLRILQLNGYEETEARDLFEVEGAWLLTDEDAADVKYIAQVTDTDTFDPLFTAALATLLASKLCVPLTGARSQAADLYKEYAGLLAGAARIADAKEGRPKRKPAWVESDLVNARFRSDVG